MKTKEFESTAQRCIICGGDNLKYRYTPRKSPGAVMTCRACGFTFIPTILNPKAIISDVPVTGTYSEAIRTSQNLADVAGSWELPIIDRKEREFPAMRENTQRSIRRLGRYARRGRMLDFGCGGGFQLKVACEEGWQGQGLEPLAAHAVYARARFGLPVVNDVLHEETFPPESFDAITAYQVFEHLPDPVQVMRMLIKALKPGGALLIEVPNIDNLLTRIMGPRHRHFVADHLNFFSSSTLSKLMQDNGLKVVSVTYPSRTMSVEHLADWTNRLIPFAQPLTRLGHNPRLAHRKVSINLHDIIEVIGVKPPG
jgi:2-polyprenyl-3-methyl-5-hydroxy-6-metoxy-1,4-benzoquinol methylase